MAPEHSPGALENHHAECHHQTAPHPCQRRVDAGAQLQDGQRSVMRCAINSATAMRIPALVSADTTIGSGEA